MNQIKKSDYTVRKILLVASYTIDTEYKIKVTRCLQFFPVESVLYSLKCENQLHMLHIQATKQKS